MPLILCKDEKVLKSWTFASDNTTVGTKTYNLTVTNKRLISTNTLPHSITRTELPLNTVKGITGSYSTSSEERANPKRGFIICGLLLLITGVILIAALITQTIAVVLGSLTAIGGMAMMIYGGAHSKTVTTYAGFKLSITTYGYETPSFSIGKQFSASDAQTTISVTHITINEAAAYEIIDMLGALIMGRTEIKLPTQTRTKKAPEKQLDVDNGLAEKHTEDDTALTKGN